ncbi:MAG: hypothetical protein IPL46_08140 [Saprospiraceae bacterium]|nr:hypothetical protein [Saprospiraceae bacterium]
MTQDELYSMLKKWINVIRRAIIATVVVEGLLVIFIGIASNKIGETIDIWLGIVIFCGLLYLLLLVVRTMYLLNFPGDVTDELQSKSKLEEYDKSFSRQKIVNEYINQTVKSLNDQTCTTNVGADPHMCDEGLQVRLKDVLKPVISNTNTILNAYHINKFTIGLHIDFYRHEPQDYSKINLIPAENDMVFIDNWEDIDDKGILILRDDLKLEFSLIHKGLLDSESETKQGLEIKSAIHKSLKNVEFVKTQFKYEDKLYTMICSDMPMVCSDTDASGVMFVIMEGVYEPVEDLPYLLRIFNRVAANYIYKYNECVFNQVFSRKQQESRKIKSS